MNWSKISILIIGVLVGWIGYDTYGHFQNTELTSESSQINTTEEPSFFGISQSTKFQYLDPFFPDTPTEGNFYLLKSVTTPHPIFDTYLVQYFKGVGVCSIRFIGKTRSREQLDLEFETVLKQMTDRYSVPNESYDDIKDNPDNTYGGIPVKEPYYRKSWNDKNFQSSFSSIFSITLEKDLIQGLTINETEWWLVGNVKFQNYENCLKGTSEVFK